MRIAVTGALGTIGSQVVRRLADTGEHTVVAVSRRPGQPAANVVCHQAAYEDVDALRSAFQDVDVLVFISSDGPDAQLILHHQNVVQAATDARVEHVVALSSVDADLASPFCYAVTNGLTERLLRSSGCKVSVARASIYTEFFRGFLTVGRDRGELRLPAADASLALVSRTDVADCLAALAAEPTERCHDLTGPQSLELAAMATIASDVWRVPMSYVPVTPADFCLDLATAQEEPWWTYAYSSMFDSIRERRWESVTDDVSRLLGRPPASLAQVLNHGRT